MPEEEKSFFDYQYAKQRIDDLVRDWDLEVKRTKYNRDVREICVNVDALRKQGKLKPDETYIPIRLIDATINREQPAKLQFVKQSPRLFIFKDPENPGANNDLIEYEMTRVSQYPGWELLYYKVIDGGATHGWDAVEYEVSEINPGGFDLLHVAHENLIFSRDSEHIQDNDIAVRVLSILISKLKSFVESDGWLKQSVDQIVKLDKDEVDSESTSNVDESREILKVFFKAPNEQNRIYVAYYNKDCSNWLKAPEPLFVGVRTLEETKDELNNITSVSWVPSPEYEFPFILYYYKESEQRKIVDHKGRVFMDDYKQEAACAIWTSYVNSLIRATNLHAAPKNPVGGAAPKQTNVIIEHGKVWTEPVDFFHTPFPDPQMLSAVQQLQTQHAEETNQVAFAVQNREDSRKTATEIQKATADQALLSGVEVTLFSTFVREVGIATWRIVKSQALQGKIKFLPVYDEEGNHVSNNISIIDRDWQIFAAGDVDVVQRAQKIQAMMQFWPVIQQTSIAQEFLIDLLKNMFPQEAARYEGIIKQAAMTDKQLLTQSAQLLEQIIKDPNISPLLGQHKQNIEALAPAMQQNLTQIM